MHSSSSLWLLPFILPTPNCPRHKGHDVVISTHSSVEVAQENELYFAGDTADGGSELVIEPILGVRCGRGCRGVHADEGGRACRGVKAESEESLGAISAWFYRIQQAVPHCKAQSVLAWFIGALPLLPLLKMIEEKRFF